MNNMSGCVMKYVVSQWLPFISIINEGTNGLMGVFGTEVKLFLEVKSKIGVDIIFSFDSDPQMSVMSGKRDILGLMKIYPRHYNNFDVLYPYGTDGDTFAVPKAKDIPKWQGIFRVFNVRIWLLITSSYISAVLVFRCMESFQSRVNQSPNQSSFISLILIILCNFLGIGVKVTLRGSFKLFFLMWILYCMHINTAYQSSLVGHLIDPGKFSPLKTLQDIEESGIEICKPDAILDTNYASLDRCMKRLEGQ
ncbi:hypothetical protein ANN_00513 [Periplaneta americana]|uniref:Ionotropic glutamate receptor C-terminal domain-containing protein n=1 Tax=Periplaneta americana TaxID=6978 RepID=A0ABQ8TTE9_PERAM|nr:hypothetical protein ANN_00513 [Periplaneta americana]